MFKCVLALTLPFTLVAGAMNQQVSKDSKPKLAEIQSDVKQAPRISIIDSKGSVVSLTDGSTYAIDPQNWDVAGGWIGNSPEVTIEDTKDGSDYPLILTNKATGSSVRATLLPKGSDMDTTQMPSDLQPAESSGDTAEVPANGDQTQSQDPSNQSVSPTQNSNSKQ
jgi:hypothetical protein